MLNNLNQYSTHSLHAMVRQLKNEIERRNKGQIPKCLKCDACHYEIEGDKYQFDDNNFICDLCYENNKKYKNWVDEYQVIRTEELTKELQNERRKAEYYGHYRPTINKEKQKKHQARCEEIKDELEKIGI